MYVLFFYFLCGHCRLQRAGSSPIKEWTKVRRSINTKLYARDEVMWWIWRSFCRWPHSNGMFRAICPLYGTWIVTRYVRMKTSGIFLNTSSGARRVRRHYWWKICTNGPSDCNQTVAHQPLNWWYIHSPTWRIGKSILQGVYYLKYSRIFKLSWNTYSASSVK